jgi:4-diphosphocytidyl-2C-methyl-D-erythritol kinase
MVNAKIALIDKLIVTIAENGDDPIYDSFKVTGKYTSAASGEDLSANNIVWKTIEKFREAFGVKDCISVELDKLIPVGAGLGGGSSDAASMLKVLCKHYFNGQLSEKIFSLALSLGADVPYFLADNSWQRVQGFGEILNQLPLSHPACKLRDKLIALVIPGFSVVTKDSFLKFKELGFEFSASDVCDHNWKLGVNDLLQASFAAQELFEPFYFELRKVVPEADIFMSGSGSCLYTFDERLYRSEQFLTCVQKLGGQVLIVGFI